MPKAKKFGTFGGVFTPSILTILGVIMYLRFPQIIGQAGLITTLGIVLLAHLISVTTGLSVASIATDKKVKAGGTYYMISRSLGLPIGGTLGLALFVGLSFSVSLYLIGFAESFLNYFDFEATKNTIRTVGTIILILVTTVTLISTSLAIKSQYFIMAAIALSLLSIFFGFGHHDFPAEKPLMHPVSDAAPFMILFGIFFPAVTGFEAGVSMSGDLKDPKKSLPVGAMAAVGVGLLTYIGLAVFYTYTVDSEALTNDPNILFKISLVPELVIAGIWGATLSSALGSILGAPRILQATAVDKITPKLFAKGAGKANEPRNALILTFVIAEIGILIGELDVIARVVSMFFITTYAFLNLAAFIESWSSSDFRPEFKIPKFVSLLGAVASILVMILLDFVALIAAIIVLGLLLIYIKRKQLILESGDAWSSFSATLVKNNITKLSKQKLQVRNWVPNILSFRKVESDDAYRLVSESLIGKLGMLTNIRVIEKQEADFILKDAGIQRPETDAKGIFDKIMECPDIYEGIARVSGIYGFSGIEPNTILTDFELSRKPDKFIKLLKNNYRKQLNTVILKFPDKHKTNYQTIDFWWKGNGRHFRFALSLLRSALQASEFNRVKIRILIINNHCLSQSKLFNGTSQILEEYRITADIKIIDNCIEKRNKFEIITTESADTDLLILGISDAVFSGKKDYFEQVSHYRKNMLLLLAGDAFENIEMLSGKQEAAEQQPAQKETPDFNLELTGIVSADTVLKTTYEKLADFYNDFKINSLDALWLAFDSLCKQYFHNADKAVKILEKASLTDNEFEKNRQTEKAYGNFLYQILSFTTDFKSEIDKLKIDFITEFSELERRLDTHFSGITDVLKLRIENQKIKIPIRQMLQHALNHKMRLYILSEFDAVPHNVALLYADIQKYNVNVGKSLSAGLQAGKDINEQIKSLKKQHSEGRELLLSELENLNHNDFITSLQNEIRAIHSDIRNRKSYKYLKRKYKTAKSDLLILDDADTKLEDTFQKISLLNNSNWLEFKLLSTKNRLRKLNEKISAKLQLRFKSAVNEHIKSLQNSLEQLKASGDLSTLIQTNKFENNLNLRDIFTSEYADLKDYMNGLEEFVEAGVLNEDSELDVQLIPFRKIINLKIENGFYEPVLKDITQVDFDLEKNFYKINDTVRLFNFNYENLEAQNAASDKLKLIDETLMQLSNTEQYTQKIFANFELAKRMYLKEVFNQLHAYSLIFSAKAESAELGKIKHARIRQQYQTLKKRILEPINNLIISLIYQKSEGQIFAEKLSSEESSNNQIQKLSALVEACSPSDELSEKLPIAYKNLFNPKFTINDDLRIWRNSEMKKADKAVQMFRQNIGGAIMITGEYQSGKSTLAQQIALKYFKNEQLIKINREQQRIEHLHEFKNEFKRAFGVNHEIETVLQNLPERHLIFIDNLELLWSRQDSGYQLLDYLFELIAKYGNRHLFLLVSNIHSYNFLNRLHQIDRFFNAVIECEPFDTEKIKDVILLRHRSGGLSFKINNRKEENISKIRLAGFFNSIFNASGGNIGVALNVWLSGISSFKNQQIILSSASLVNLSPLEYLEADMLNLLVQFVLHKRLKIDKLMTLSAMSKSELNLLLSPLERSRILIKENEAYMINRVVMPYVLEVLANKKLI